jgi:biliverdin reductase
MTFTANSPLNVAIIGTGFAAHKRAEALQADPRANLVAVAGHTPPSTQEFCDTFGVKATDSIEALLGLPEVDLVIICTVNRDHSAIAQAALTAQKNVCVEYPLSLNPTEAQNLLQLAKAQNKLLHVEHIELLGGLHQTIRHTLPEIGETFFVRYSTVVPQNPAPQKWTYHHDLFGFPFSAALSRIHRLTDLFGQVATVSCHTRFWDTRDGYYRSCLAQAQLKFHNGVIADVTYGKGETFWQRERNFELHGDQGSLIFIADEGTLIKGEDTSPVEVAPRRGLFAQETTLLLDHLIDSKPLYVNPEASLYALQVADAARQSAETGKTVQL